MSMKHILIADSGSSKTDWILVSEENDTLDIQTAGINAVRDAQCVVLDILQQQLRPSISERCLPTDIYFYGAGCMPPYSSVIKDSLQQVFPTAAHIEVESDLLGASRALCKEEPGIACILGTGANSCYYDGKDIVEHTPCLGFILGDEGSGAVLGRLLISELIKGEMDPALKSAFDERYHLTQTEIIDRVYRKPQPNRFLASLTPFLYAHHTHPDIKQLLVQEFRRFLTRNVKKYQKNLPVNFVGSIAFHFREELTSALAKEGMTIGLVLKSPIRELQRFHAMHIG